MSKQEPPVTGARGATCRRSDGQPCNRYPVAGSTICETHLLNPKAKANAKMRAAVAAFSPDVPDVDAGMVLLRMLAYAADRQRYYAGLLARRHAELGPDPTLDQEVSFAVFDTYVEGSKSGEQVRALVKWEAHWLSETARLAKVALDAGIAERQVRLAEAQGQLVVAFAEHLVAGLAGLVAGMVAAGRPVALDVADPQVRAVVHAALLTIEGETA